MPKVPGVIISAAAGLPYHSAKRTRLNWTQFSGNINAAIDYVALKIDDEYVPYQHDSRANATYFMFYSKENAEKCMNTPIYYNGIAVELYQTVTLEEGTQIITIPSTNRINIRIVVEAVNNAFIKNKIIMTLAHIKTKDASQYAVFANNKSIGTLKTMFVDINNKMSQKPQTKSKEPEDHTVKSMQKKIDNFFGKAKKNEQKIILRKVHNEIAPQVKAIKDSNKPNKLQSLELNNKKEELISKENKDWPTDFNRIKQPEEINLEISDQPIYADSSCPPTPNFKKEWDKSDENHTENNVSAGCFKIKRIRQKNKKFRHYMHYNDALEPLIDDILEWLNCKLGAHCRKEIIKKIRKSSKNKKHTKKNSNSNFKVMTFNVQSIYNKVEDLELILNKTNPAVLCLQETHLSEKTSLLQLKGYTCAESKKNLTKTGSGLLIAVQNRSSWGISELRNEYSWMSEK
ncbi:hypothetical protein BB561_003794 [Smittium simulii]|uniref:Endonuclease/exonuclease/phosphatase domain-containing protein n=1 Tax=Smittium simulii TaxID=133385 RepID=A0A2T9YJJ5_9FUNG|nr:hypothetical protein BB561_003794 [Smittium simulii]